MGVSVPRSQQRSENREGFCPFSSLLDSNDSDKANMSKEMLKQSQILFYRKDHWSSWRTGEKMVDITIKS